MAFTIWHLFQASLLCINALAILNEKRFLRKVGFDSLPTSGQQESSVKSQIINLLKSIRTLMRLPLIVINLLTILFALVFG